MRCRIKESVALLVSVALLGLGAGTTWARGFRGGGSLHMPVQSFRTSQGFGPFGGVGSFAAPASRTTAFGNFNRFNSNRFNPATGVNAAGRFNNPFTAGTGSFTNAFTGRASPADLERSAFARMPFMHGDREFDRAIARRDRFDLAEQRAFNQGFGQGMGFSSPFGYGGGGYGGGGYGGGGYGGGVPYLPYPFSPVYASPWDSSFSAAQSPWVQIANAYGDFPETIGNPANASQGQAGGNNTTGEIWMNSNGIGAYWNKTSPNGSRANGN